MNDLMGFGAMRALQERGVRVPEEVSVLGMDDLEIAEMVSPPLTTIHYPIKELVERAMELLISQITSREAPFGDDRAGAEPDDSGVDNAMSRDRTGRCRLIPR